MAALQVLRGSSIVQCEARPERASWMRTVRRQDGEELDLAFLLTAKGNPALSGETAVDQQPHLSVGSEQRTNCGRGCGPGKKSSMSENHHLAPRILARTTSYCPVGEEMGMVQDRAKPGTCPPDRIACTPNMGRRRLPQCEPWRQAVWVGSLPPVARTTRTCGVVLCLP